MSTTKEVTHQSEAYGSVKFHNAELGQACGLFSHEAERQVINGKFSINLLQSKKFGEQVQFQIYGSAVKKESRALCAWSRCELYFPLAALPELISALNATYTAYLNTKKTEEKTVTHTTHTHTW